MGRLALISAAFVLQPIQPSSNLWNRSLQVEHDIFPRKKENRDVSTGKKCSSRRSKKMHDTAVEMHDGGVMHFFKRHS